MENIEEGPLPEKQKCNTTSSMYISSSFHKPDMKTILQAMANVIKDQMMADTEKEFPKDHSLQFFNEEKYMRDKPELFSEERKRVLRDEPKEEQIFEFIYAIYMIAEFSHECCIVGLVYLFRLIRIKKMPLLNTTWRPTVFTALLVSQKVIDDVCLKNADFLSIYPFFDLNECNKLEQKFVQILDFDLHVRSSLYAKYFFELRDLAGGEQNLPKEPLTSEQAKNLEIKSKKFGEQKKADEIKSLGYKPQESKARATLD